MATRSAQLCCLITPAAGTTLLFQAPSDELVLVKSIAASTFESAVDTLDFFVYSPVTAVSVIVERFTNFETSVPRYSERWIALEPGDSLNASAALAGARILVSGARLPVPLVATTLPA